MKSTMRSRDPDIKGSEPALRRAARTALRLARATGTPIYVLKAGKIVNLNPKGANGKSNGHRLKSGTAALKRDKA